ncbi:ABC transporter ATP-binding protein [Thermodesulfobacteriota bacterium]
MADKIISVRGISKKYYINKMQNHDASHGFVDTLLLPFRIMRGQIHNSSDNGDEMIWALKDINLDIYRGERIGIIGKNGAGKTTLLKILSRLVYPTEGEAIIRGRTTSLFGVGTGFNRTLTGRENIYLDASLHGLSKSEINERFGDIVDFSGVGKFIDTPVKYYSNGMNARLAFSVAAHLDPDILFLDEVLSVGDLEFQRKCLNRMESLTSEGRTILFVSHSLGAIVQFCNKVLWIDNGKNRFFGEAITGVNLYQDECKAENNKPLSKKTDRIGTGVAKITNLCFLDNDQKSCECAKTGESFYVQIEYEFQEKLSTRPYDVFVNLIFSNDKGVRIFGVPSDVLSNDITDLGACGRFLCRIDNLPLLPGLYNVQVGFHVNRQVVDKLPEAAKLVVVEGNYYGTGKLPIVYFGNVCTKYNWKHIKK